LSDNDEQLKKLGKAAVQAAKEMLDSLPDDAEYVQGRQVLSGKETKEKFKTDEKFATKTAIRIFRLKFDVFMRSNPNNPKKKEKPK